jgi:site-specific DNA recombinase
LIPPFAGTENARQQFWNVGRPPYGYASLAAGQRGSTTKKQLGGVASEGEVVRLTFRLYQTGDGASGPLGVKNMTSWMNGHGSRTRPGARWGIAQIHRMLADPTYKGECWHSRNGEGEDRVLMQVPAIIDARQFDAAQGMLRERNPKKAPPRVVSGPILLTSVATCASCRYGMNLRTGKSGRYQY